MSETTLSAQEALDAARRRRARLAVEQQSQKYARDLMTPEGAALRLRIATASERAGAFLIDLTIMILALILGVISIIWVVGQLGFEGLALGSTLLSLFVFALRNFYFVSFELGRRAATPGKRVLGLRVAARDGGRLTANAVFARNFLREVEVFLPLQFLVFGLGDDAVNGWIALFGFAWSGLFLFFPIFNRDKLRAGDLIAGTWVIHAPKITLDKDVAVAAQRRRTASTLGGYTFSPAQLDVYGIHELHVLENVLRKSSTDVREAVADRIRKKIGWNASPGEDDRIFLEAYYAALRRHLEQKLILGKRKVDKFDRS
ncbi:MAG: RDD family protein [Pseudomonadota bacterium]